MSMRIAVLTSGGDAPGMNAAIRMLVKVAYARGHQPLGVRDGYRGLMAGNLEPVALKDVDGITRFGGTILGSARALEFQEPAGRAKAVSALKAFGAEGLVVIGGNGSLTGAHMLAKESHLKVVGIPASIDNDVGHTRLCIGVDTAVNTIVEACDRISDTATAHRRAFIVEVMGRDNGFLAMRAGMAAEADAILFAERKRSEEEILDELSMLLMRCFAAERGKRRVLILKSEGVHVPTRTLVEKLTERMARFAPGITVRETVLGHVVRGGSPSQVDRVMAQRLAFGAIDALEDGDTDVMLGWDTDTDVGTATSDPRVRRVPIGEVLEETRRVLEGTSKTILGRVEQMNRASEVLAL